MNTSGAQKEPDFTTMVHQVNWDGRYVSLWATRMQGSKDIKIQRYKKIQLVQRFNDAICLLRQLSHNSGIPCQSAALIMSHNEQYDTLTFPELHLNTVCNCNCMSFHSHLALSSPVSLPKWDMHASNCHQFEMFLGSCSKQDCYQFMTLVTLSIASLCIHLLPPVIIPIQLPAAV